MKDEIRGVKCAECDRIIQVGEPYFQYDHDEDYFCEECTMKYRYILCECDLPYEGDD